MKITEAVENIARACYEAGMEVSPEEVAFICSTFTETVIKPMMPNSAAEEVIQSVADEINRVRDEGCQKFTL